MRTLKSILSPQDDIKNDITLNIDPDEWFKKAIKEKDIIKIGPEPTIQIRKTFRSKSFEDQEYLCTMYEFTDNIIDNSTFAVILKEFIDKKHTGEFGFGIWFKPYNNTLLTCYDTGAASHMINLYHGHKDEYWWNIKSKKEAEQIVKKLLFKSYQVLNDDYHHWATMLSETDNILGYKYMDINNILNEEI